MIRLSVCAGSAIQLLHIDCLRKRVLMYQLRFSLLRFGSCQVCSFLLGAVIPYYIPTFKKWPDKCQLNSFKILVIQLEFKCVHNMNSGQYIINMLMPAAIVREV